MSQNVVKNQLKLAKEALNNNDLDAVKRFASTALDYDEHNYVALLLLAAAWQKEKQVERADFYFNKAILKNPDALPAYQGLYKLYTEFGGKETGKLALVLSQLQKLALAKGPFKDEKEANTFIGYLEQEIQLQNSTDIKGCTAICDMCSRFLDSGPVRDALSQFVTTELQVRFLQRYVTAASTIDSIVVAEQVRQKRNRLGAAPVSEIEEAEWRQLFSRHSLDRNRYRENLEKLTQLSEKTDTNVAEQYLTFMVRHISAIDDRKQKSAILAEIGRYVQQHLKGTPPFSLLSLHLYINLQNCLLFSEYDIRPLELALAHSSTDAGTAQISFSVLQSLLKPDADVADPKEIDALVPQIAYYSRCLESEYKSINVAGQLVASAEKADKVFGVLLDKPLIKGFLASAELAPALEDKVQFYQKALLVNDKLPDALLGLGYAFLNQNAPEKAKPLFETCLQHTPDDAKANAGLAQCLALEPDMSANLPRIVRLFDKSLSLSESASVAYWKAIALWKVYLSSNKLELPARLEDVETGFKLAAEHNLPSAQSYLGWYIAVVEQDMDKALRIFAKEHPSKLLSKAAACYCDLLLQKPDKPAAVALCSWFSMSANSEPWAILQLGLLKLNDKNYESACQFFKKLVRLKPDERQYLQLLAESYFRLGKYPAALRVLEHKALQLNSPDISFIRARLFQRLFKYEQSVSCLEDALALSDTESHTVLRITLLQTLRRFALDCERKGAYGLALDKALYGFGQGCKLLACRLKPELQHMVLKWTADCLFICGKMPAFNVDNSSATIAGGLSVLSSFDIDSVLGSFKEPISKSESQRGVALSWAVRCYAGAIYVALRCETTAASLSWYWHDFGVACFVFTEAENSRLSQFPRECLMKAIALMPSEAWFYLTLGNILMKDKPDVAQHCFVKSSQLNPKLAAPLCALGFVLLSKKEYTLAERAFNDAETLSSSQVDAWIGQFLVSHVNSSADKCRPLNAEKLEHALQLLNENATTKTRYRPFFVLYAHVFANDCSKAASVLYSLAKAVEQNPDDKCSWNLRGLVLEREGAYSEAARCFKKAGAVDNYNRANLSNGQTFTSRDRSGGDSDLVHAINLFFESDFQQSLCVLESINSNEAKDDADAHTNNLVKLASLKVLFSLIQKLPKDKRSAFVSKGTNSIMLGLESDSQLFLQTAAAWAATFADDNLIKLVMQHVNWTEIDYELCKVVGLALYKFDLRDGSNRKREFFAKACFYFPHCAWPASLLALSCQNSDKLAIRGFAADSTGEYLETYIAYIISLIRRGAGGAGKCSSVAVKQHFDTLKSLASRALFRYPHVFESRKVAVLLGMTLSAQVLWDMASARVDAEPGELIRLSAASLQVLKRAVCFGDSRLEPFLKFLFSKSMAVHALLTNSSGLLQKSLEAASALVQRREQLVADRQEHIVFDALRFIQQYSTLEQPAMARLDSFKKMVVKLPSNDSKSMVRLSRLYCSVKHMESSLEVLRHTLRGSLASKDVVAACVLYAEMLQRFTLMVGDEHIPTALETASQALHLITSNSSVLQSFLPAVKFLQSVLYFKQCQADQSIPRAKYEKQLENSYQAGRFRECASIIFSK